MQIVTHANKKLFAQKAREVAEAEAERFKVEALAKRKPTKRV